MTTTVLAKPDLRASKPSRTTFVDQPRRPIRIILDAVTGNYNIGALFRLCDAMLVEQLVICGPSFELRKRKITQAAQGAQKWVPWRHVLTADLAVVEARTNGYQIVAVELTSASVAPEQFVPQFPLCLVIGGERSGVSPTIIREADACLAIEMHGMANSLNLATATAIVLYELCKHLDA